jgi:hypothetical protein
MKYVITLGLIFFVSAIFTSIHAQIFEVQELVLDIEKLAQEKQLLSDLYTGYEIVDKGYGEIRDVSKGSYDLHKGFLDGLLVVSPAVKNYHRIAEIVDLQLKLAASYKSAWARFRQDPHLRPDEIGLLANVYSGLFDQTVQILNSLTLVLTDGQLRANDGERIRQIDGLYSGMQNKWLFLQSMNNRTEWLSLQRAAASGENTGLKQLYGL